MKGVYWVILAIIFLAACSNISGILNQKALNKTAQASSVKNENTAPKTASKTETKPKVEVVPIKCEDGDGLDIYTRGKVVIYYSDNSKESLDDFCPGKNTIINVFQGEYFCNGTTAKYKINKCTGNCSDGACPKLA